MLTTLLGQVYSADKHQFTGNLSRYLQAYEMCLIGQLILKTLETYPNTQLTDYFYNGAVLSVDKNEKKLVIKCLNEKVLDVGQGLGLLYPQKIEFKATHSNYIL